MALAGVAWQPIHGAVAPSSRVQRRILYAPLAGGVERRADGSSTSGEQGRDRLASVTLVVCEWFDRSPEIKHAGGSPSEQGTGRVQGGRRVRANVMPVYRSGSSRLFLTVIAALAVVVVVVSGCSGSTPVPPDVPPTFSETVDDQSYTVGEAIQSLTLPAATGGDGTLTYSLGPMIPDGLTFDAATRTLSGTPTTAGTYVMTYTVADADDNSDDTDTAEFTITVREAPTDEECDDWNTRGFFSTATVEDVTACIRAGADVNARDDAGRTPLHYAAQYSDDPAIITALLSAMASVNVTDDDGRTPLDVAQSPAIIAALRAAGGECGERRTFADGTCQTDTAPSFTGTVENQTYTVGEAIEARTLPDAAGGNGTLTYSLGPMIPDGLMFDGATRTLSGTPTTAGTYVMTYTVADADDNSDDTDTAEFTITVQEPEPPAMADYVGTWYFAVPVATILVLGEDTFALTVGDGSPIAETPPFDAVTGIAVEGAVAVNDITATTVTMELHPETVTIEPTPLSPVLTALIIAVARGEVAAKIDGDHMSVSGQVFAGIQSLLQLPPDVELTACRDAPCVNS